MAASRWKSKLALKRQPMKSTGECSRIQRSSQHNGQNNSSNETSTTGSKQMFTVFWIPWIACVAWIMAKINWFNSTSNSILYSSLIKTHCRINFARYINSTNTLKLKVYYHRGIHGPKPISPGRWTIWKKNLGTDLGQKNLENLVVCWTS